MRRKLRNEYDRDSYLSGSPQEIGLSRYPVSGTAHQWFYKSFDSVSFTLELLDPENTLFWPKKELRETSLRNMDSAFEAFLEHLGVSL